MDKEYKYQISDRSGDRIFVARGDVITDVQMGIDELMQKTTPQVNTGPQAPVVGYCSIHNIQMKERQKDGKTFYSHARQVEGNWQYCSGKGWPTDINKEVEESFNDAME